MDNTSKHEKRNSVVENRKSKKKENKLKDDLKTNQ